MTALPLATTQQRADALAAARPALPYRSATVDGLSGVTVRVDSNGEVMVDGLAHTPAAALELSAAIARAARETTPPAREEVLP